MKKIISVLFVLFLAVGCGSGGSTGDEKQTEGKELKEISIAVSPSPHAEIVESLKSQLEAEGYTLSITEFDDYILPNTAVENDEINANFFQHGPYLNDFNKENNTHLVSVGTVHFEPLGLYAGKAEKTDSLDVDSIADGARIAVPNDTTNEARALKLLEAQGIIKLKEGADFTATVNDIIENPKNVEVIELEAKLIPAQLVEVDYAIINGNYALGANVQDKVILTESSDSDSAKTYANVLVVKEGNENNDEIKALIKALQSEETQKFINEKYEGIVVPVVD